MADPNQIGLAVMALSIFIMERLRKIKNLFLAKDSIQYYRRDSFYYAIYSHYNYLERLLNGDFKEKESIAVKRRIKFGFDLEFGLKSKQIIEKLGKPYFTYSNKHIPGHTIYFFKRKVYKYKMKFEIHLYKDVFFLGIYTLDVSKAEALEIIQDICDKYQIDADTFLSDKNKIVDHVGNTLDVEHKLNLVIAYIDGNNKEIDRLRSKRVTTEKNAERKNSNAFQKFYELL